MSRQPNASNVPPWIRNPVGLLAAVFVGPAVLGMLGFIAAVLAPLGIVVLPFVVWGLSHADSRGQEPSHVRLPPHRAREPMLQPS